MIFMPVLNLTNMKQLLEQKLRLAFTTPRGTYFFSPEQIIRMEARSNYTHVHFIDHKPILQAKVLKEYEALLEHVGFLRTHRSHLVNRKYISFVDSEGSILMQDESKAEISRRKKREIMKVLKAA
jgi:two-component system LytT family response regulator